MQSVNGGCRAFLIGVRARFSLCRYDGSRLLDRKLSPTNSALLLSYFFTEILQGYGIFIEKDRISISARPNVAFKIYIASRSQPSPIFHLISQYFYNISFHNDKLFPFLNLYLTCIIPCFAHSNIYIYTQSSSQYTSIFQNRFPTNFPTPLLFFHTKCPIQSKQNDPNIRLDCHPTYISLPENKIPLPNFRGKKRTISHRSPRINPSFLSNFHQKKTNVKNCGEEEEAHV